MIRLCFIEAMLVLRTVVPMPAAKFAYIPVDFDRAEIDFDTIVEFHFGAIVHRAKEWAYRVLEPTLSHLRLVGSGFEPDPSKPGFRLAKWLFSSCGGEGEFDYGGYHYQRDHRKKGSLFLTGAVGCSSLQSA